MSVLVTGGAGYIGSHTVRALRDAGVDVVVLDSLEYGHRRRGASTRRSKSATSPTPRSSRRVVEEHGVDSVVHFAAYKAAGESMEVPERYFENNVGRTARLLAAIHEAGVERIVFSSTCAVYGTPAHPSRRRGTPHRAREPLRREQADRRADAALVRRVSRPAERRAPLLQRGRRVGRRPHRRGQPAPAQPGAARDAGRARPDPAAHRQRHRLPHARRVHASATTSTSTTSPTRTCARSAISSRAATSTVVNVGTGRGASTIEVIDGAKRVSGVDFADHVGAPPSR